MDPKYFFQYCQKLVVFSKDSNNIFLAKRKNESHYDGVYAFIGGKMETSDKSIVDGLRREKIEEVGEEMQISFYPGATHNKLFKRKDGFLMILPHYIAKYKGGKIKLNEEEYSEYKWVEISEIDIFEPKVDNIPEIIKWAAGLKSKLSDEEFIPL